MLTITKKKVIFLLGTTIILIIICYGIKNLFFMVSPINIDINKVDKISVEIHYYSYLKDMNYGTEVIDKTEIEEFINEIEKIKICEYDFSIDDLGGESPNGIISFYNRNKEVIDSIYLYDNLLYYNKEYYKISDSLYNKIDELCQKSGTYWNGEFN